jgi:hypothetical protein
LHSSSFLFSQCKVTEFPESTDLPHGSQSDDEIDDEQETVDVEHDVLLEYVTELVQVVSQELELVVSHELEEVVEGQELELDE